LPGPPKLKTSWPKSVVLARSSIKPHLIETLH
jgi:hypothetical protein